MNTSDPYLYYLILNATLCFILGPIVIWLYTKSGEQWLKSYRGEDNNE